MHDDPSSNLDQCASTPVAKHRRHTGTGGGGKCISMEERDAERASVCFFFLMSQWHFIILKARRPKPPSLSHSIPQRVHCRLGRPDYATRAAKSARRGQGWRTRHLLSGEKEGVKGSLGDQRKRKLKDEGR